MLLDACADLVNLWVWLPFRFVLFLDLLVPAKVEPLSLSEQQLTFSDSLNCKNPAKLHPIRSHWDLWLVSSSSTT